MVGVHIFTSLLNLTYNYFFLMILHLGLLKLFITVKKCKIGWMGWETTGSPETYVAYVEV